MSQLAARNSVQVPVSARRKMINQWMPLVYRAIEVSHKQEKHHVEKSRSVIIVSFATLTSAP